jgi:hypothetical protein
MAKLTEVQVQLVNEVIRGVLADLNLSAELRKAARTWPLPGSTSPAQLALTTSPAEG